MTNQSAPPGGQSPPLTQQSSELDKPINRGAKRRQAAYVLLGGLWIASGLTAIGSQAIRTLLDGQTPVASWTLVTLTGVIWIAAMFATTIAAPVCLTAWRLIAPSVLLGVAAIVWGAEKLDSSGIVACVLAVAAVVVAMSAEFAQRAVNGLAFKNERRFLLRAPGAFALGPMQFACAITSISATTAIVAAANARWIVCVIAAIVALPAAYVVPRVLHQFSLRWAVIVPTGIVIKDPLVLNDTILAPYDQLRQLAPAPLNSDALDLTENALGLILELQLVQSTFVAKKDLRTRKDFGYHATGILFAPLSPAEFLATIKQARQHDH
jgi:hypothetical protein